MFSTCLIWILNSKILKNDRKQIYAGVYGEFENGKEKEQKKNWTSGARVRTPDTFSVIFPPLIWIWGWWDQI